MTFLDNYFSSYNIVKMVILMYIYNVNTAVGNVIRKYREARNLTQEELAELCGISPAYFGRLERGEHSMTLDKCQKIAAALGVRLADFFEELEQ